MIGLLDRPNAGSYRLDDTETTDLPEEQRAVMRREHVGFVFQTFHLIPRLTAADNIGLPMLLAGVEPARRQRRINEVLSALDLTSRAKHRPHQLSGGQRQRVAIGRAIVMRPKFLLADEPTGNLDRHAGDDVIATVNQARSDIPAVTHVDRSARIQTVHAETNPRYHRILEEFAARTGCPAIINTSFNVRGEPIVCTPEDAYRCFMRTEMDYLVVENYLMAKTEQPEWKKDDSWMDESELDG